MGKNQDQKGPFLFEEILKIVGSVPGKMWNYKQIAAELGIRAGSERKVIIDLLNDLSNKGLLEEPEKGKYTFKGSSSQVTGRVDMTSTGAAYIITGEGAGDIYIAPRNTKGAFHGDTVEVRTFGRRRQGGGRTEGEIVSIIKRGRTDFVATLEVEKKVAFGITDNRKYPDFIVPLDKIGKAKHGQKVVIRFADWEDFSDLPRGEVISVLGEPGNNETEINAIMVEFGLPYHFPKEVTKYAELLPLDISADEISRRRDFRNITTFTIDPFDAKDFDDALSIRKLDNGRWEIGVHIADVTHYLKPDSILDKEAFERATSVYLVDRVVPMLPEVLSNFVCSLRPKEDKLTFSSVFEMDEAGKIYSEWFGRTIIHSDRRFTYEEVQQMIEGQEGDFKVEIMVLDKIAKALRAERMKNGSITFEKEEVKFHLDENGNPTGVYFKQMKDSNQLIEDFMLLANRRVSEYVALFRKAGEKTSAQIDTRRPFVYRIHAAPDPEKVREFSGFVSTFGYRMNAGSENALAQSLNKLLKDVQGKPEANMIETLAIRTMAKAVYSTDNIGHYGLGFRYYTHFTSPIRRYPDVLVHRLLQYYLEKDAGKTQQEPPDLEMLESECKHCSDREKLAAEAERASIKYKQVQFLQDKIGQEFDAVVSGVTEFGFFAELSGNKCEGMVHVRSLTDDRYVFDEESYRLRGLRTGNTFVLGDTVRVKIKSADLIKKQIDFEMVRSVSHHTERVEREGPFHPTRPEKWNPSGESKNRKEKKKNKGGRKNRW